MDLKDILEMHARLYPKMQVQDAVKLVYQNEFGGGHLVRDVQESLSRIISEWQQAKKEGRAIPSDLRFVDVGNGLCRLDLSVLDDTAIEPSTVNRFFVNTSGEVKGSVERFERKIDILKRYCKEGRIRFEPVELERYLDDYRRRGYPAVSHSDIYRASYFPCYRIVKNDYRRYFDVFCRIDSLMKSGESITVAIDGNSGAGKSTLAALLADVYDCNVFHMDDFFLRPEQRTAERLAKTGEFVDHERFRQEVMAWLKGGKPFSYRKFDCGKMTLGESVKVSPKSLNIVEGSYSMHPELIENYDLKIFLHVDPEEQEQRIRKRNGEEMLKRFREEWIPRENRYF